MTLSMSHRFVSAKRRQCLGQRTIVPDELGLIHERINHEPDCRKFSRGKEQNHFFHDKRRLDLFRSSEPLVGSARFIREGAKFQNERLTVRTGRSCCSLTHHPTTNEAGCCRGWSRRITIGMPISVPNKLARVLNCTRTPRV